MELAGVIVQGRITKGAPRHRQYGIGGEILEVIQQIVSIDRIHIKDLPSLP